MIGNHSDIQSYPPNKLARIMRLKLMPVPTSSPSSFGSSQTANPTVESDQSKHSSVEDNAPRLAIQLTEDLRKPPSF